MKRLINIKILILFLTAILFQRCATAYKPVQPDRLILWDQQYIDPDSTVTIEIVNHILGSNEFNKFVKAEKENGFHMVALKIQNHGTRDIQLPEDLEIWVEDGYGILPLNKSESINALTAALEPDQGNSNINLDEGWVKSTWDVGRVTPLLISYFKLNKNMKDYYIEKWTVCPGEKAAGFLLLPIPGNKPFQVCLR